MSANFLLQFVCGPVADCAYDLDTSLRVTANGTAATSTSSCDGMATATVVNGMQPYTYLWSDIAGQVSPVAVNLCAGSYTITVTDALGATASTSVTIEDATGLSEHDNHNAFSVYPNPAGSFSTIRLDNVDFLGARFALYDTFGRVVRREKTLHHKELIIDRDGLPNGMYFIKILHNEGQYTAKLIFE
jgi:hypothetical protein